MCGAGLEFFEYVFLCASQQDRYVPFFSARAEPNKEVMADRKRGDLFTAMVTNLLRPLGNCELRRIDVSFVVKKRSVDSFIGREAHIAFIANQAFVSFFFSVFMWSLE